MRGERRTQRWQRVVDRQRRGVEERHSRSDRKARRATQDHHASARLSG
jgi:hypothetical protein